MKQLNSVNSGDKVAILSLSSDAAHHFPWVLDLGIKRLVDNFRLVPVEYGTTRKKKPSPKDRAADLMKAFADPNIKAILTTIGGVDQVKILPYIDANIIRSNPKPFMGYSDNTNLAQYLFNLGIPSLYGGALMVQFAFPGSGMHQMSIDSIHAAFSKSGKTSILASNKFTEIDLEWGDKANLKLEREFDNNEGLYWSGEDVANGILWGGCIESLLQYFSAGRRVENIQEKSIILFLESAENVPDNWVIETLIFSLAEQGILESVSGVLIGRPKSWSFDKQLTKPERVMYKEKQRQKIIETIRSYKKNIPIVQNVDFGHTEPQIIIPMGNQATIDPTNKHIYLEY